MERRTYKIGLLIGRFQPFHNGHLYLIKESLNQVEKLIIGIGSSNVQNLDNPFDFETRKKMIETVFAKEGLEDKLLQIIPIPDAHDDDEWLRLVLKAAGKFDISIGQNEWTNGILEKAGYNALRFPFYKRYVLEGKKIRERMRKGKEWKDRVPPYLGFLFPKSGLE